MPWQRCVTEPIASPIFRIAAVVEGPRRRIDHTVETHELVHVNLSLPTRVAAGEAGTGNNDSMSTAVFVIALISALVTAAIVLWLFVWAARKDGEFDREVHSRLRRRPRR